MQKAFGVCVWGGVCVQVHEFTRRPEEDISCPVLSLSTLLA